MPWRQWADSFYWRVQPLLAPNLLNSQYTYVGELERSILAARRWLDLGCGHELLPLWIRARGCSVSTGRCQVVGIDFDHDALRRHKSLRYRIRGNIELLPFANGAFDLVTANMVLEHVANPEPLFVEVRRVLARGGTFIVHTPNLHGYTTVITRLVPGALRARLAALLLGRNERDVFPTFYRANTGRSLERLAGRSGLSLVRLEYLESSAQLIAIPPLLVGELALIRALRWRPARSLRPCILAAFEKRS